MPGYQLLVPYILLYVESLSPNNKTRQLSCSMKNGFRAQTVLARSQTHLVFVINSVTIHFTTEQLKVHSDQNDHSWYGI